MQLNQKYKCMDRNTKQNKK